MKTKIFNHSLLRLVLVGERGLQIKELRVVKFLLFTSLLLYPFDGFAGSYYDAYIGGIYYNLKEQEAQVYSRDTDMEKNKTAYSGNLIIPKSIVYKGKTYMVTAIGRHAFYGCDGLISVTIPNSIKSIDTSSFYNCTGLENIIVETGNPVYDSRNNCNGIIVTATNALVVGCKNTKIPDSVTSIECGAFWGCKGLTSLVIPDNVTKIGDYAFCYCSGLTSIKIPSSVKSIGHDAFSGVRNLKSVYISDLYAWCKIPEEQYEDEIFGKKSNAIPCEHDLYLNGKKITDLVIPDGITAINAFAFKNSTGIISVTIPKEVTSIASGAFSGCQDIEKMVVESGNSTYDSRDGSNTIIRTSSNTLIATCKSSIIPQSVKAIDAMAFRGNKGLKSVTIPDAITTIGDHLFSGCSKLSEIVFSQTLKGIGEQAFLGCESLRFISIPNTVTSIGYMAFYRCTNLESVVVPDHSVYIDGVFNKCPRLSSVKGHSILYPDYLNNDWHVYDTSCPFYNNVVKNFNDMKKSFSYYAYGRIKQVIKEWQKKKEYETTEQWRTRVTEETRLQKVNEMIENLRTEYITRNTPTTFNGTLGDYDADYGTFPLKIGDTQTLYISVPQADAPIFKEKWGKVKATPVYGILNDMVGVLSCTFTLKGKTYNLSRTFRNDNAADLALNLSPLELNLNGNQGTTREVPAQQPQPTAIDRSIDQHIPMGTGQNAKTFAVIIGNERYTQVAQVPYAQNDAKVFAEYCKRTLGLPDNNVRTYDNATFGTMLAAVNDVKSIVEAYKGDCNVIFYYAGHGVPNETSHDAFLLPVDADGRQTEACYPVSRLYRELGTMGARSVVVFMDACFSGAQRGEGMLASARGVALKAKADTPQGNMVVFSAATGDETAYPYAEKGHGMFTYFLLKKLQETKGDVTLGELGEYIQTNVRQQAVVVNRKSQTPTVVSSAVIAENWRTIKLK